MIIDSEQLEAVLGTFKNREFAPAVSSARRLVGLGGRSISRTETTVPTSELRRIYGRRGLNPRLRPEVARQYDQLARVAGLFPNERWHILIVATSERPEVTIFSNEEGVGRVCLDFTVP
jgi:hypothetical protein